MLKRFMAMFMALVLLCACVPAMAADDELTTIKGTTKATVKVKSKYADNEVISGVSSTTGLPASGEAFTPILMVVDNSENAHPHWGLSQADILFQIPNAGAGATKLMALFADQYPEAAGGVRSARASMIPIAMAWNAAFVHAGGPELGDVKVDPDYLMRKWKMKSTGRDFNLLGGKYCNRIDTYFQPHNLSCHIKEIHDSLVADGVTFEERPFLFTDEPLTGGKEATYIRMLHRGDNKDNNVNPASTSYFTYDEEKGAYIRSNSSGDYIDRDTGEVIPFANVIVLRTAFTWVKGYVCLKNHLVGSGCAEFFENGQYVRGAWFRKDEKSRIVFVGPDGKEMPMQRGKTFIVVTNGVTEVAYK